MREHSIKGKSGQILDFGRYDDAIDNLARSEIVEHPEKMLLIDAIHGCAKALTVAEYLNMHIVQGGFFREAIHKMHLRADRPV